MKFNNIKYQSLLADHTPSLSVFPHAKLIVLVILIIVVVLCLFIPLPFSLSSIHRSSRFSQVEYESQDESQIDGSLSTLFNQFSNKLTHELDEAFKSRGNNSASIQVPARIQLNNTETNKLAESDSNLALVYWDKWNAFTDEKPSKSNVKHCENVNLPDPIYLKQYNRYWQVLKVKASSSEMVEMFLYNAFYDKKHGPPTVKLITTNDNDKLLKNMNWWCLLWFDKVKWPTIVKVSDYYTLMGDKPGLYHPEVITCPIPQEYADQIPEAVSLQAEGQCEKIDSSPSNVLRVIYEPRSEQTKNRRSIGVCVQAFRFGTYDVSVRLVEWLEMVKLMGGDKVYFYVYGAMHNMRKVIEHYEQEGLVVSRPITLPGTQPNIESLYNLWAFKLGESFWPQELIELNDCLYRNLYRHDYLAVFDIDEMIVPQKAANWLELIENIENKMSARTRDVTGHYVNRHAHVCEVFEDNTKGDKPIPEYLYMMRHTYRSKVYNAWSNIKCFQRTDQVTVTHNHAPIQCKGGKSCKPYIIDPSESVLWHYRRNQSAPGYTQRNTDCPVHEKTTWRWYEQLESNVRLQLSQLFAN